MIVGVTAVVVTFSVLPFRLGTYANEVLILFFLNVILVVSFRLIVTTGDWSLAHFVLMGVGAYSSTIMSKYLGWSFWGTVPLAALIAALIGLGFIKPLTRMKGFGFFIGSYAAGEFVRLMWIKFDNPFGGSRGIIKIPSPGTITIPGLGIFDLHYTIPYYFLTLVAAAVSVIIMYQIDRSRLGDALKAIHWNDILAESVGMNIVRLRTTSFVVGSFFAGLAGALFAHHLGAIDPRVFEISQMLYLLVWVVVGGTQTFLGPIIGLGTMTAIFEVTRTFAEWRPLVFGFILIFFLLFLPAGIEGIPARVLPWVKGLRRRIRGE